MRSYYIWLIIVILQISCGKGKHNPEACNGNTRRELKVAIDSRIGEVRRTPIVTTIDSLGSIAVPEVDSKTGRQDVELNVYTVTGQVDKISKEHDGDYHIRLVSGAEYLICEAANPGCGYAQRSVFYPAYVQVRQFIEEHEDDLEGKTVTVTGIAFIDIDHHYSRKQADNNMELHPILDIHF